MHGIDINMIHNTFFGMKRIKSFFKEKKMQKYQSLLVGKKVIEDILVNVFLSQPVRTSYREPQSPLLLLLN